MQNSSSVKNTDSNGVKASLWLVFLLLFALYLREHLNDFQSHVLLRILTSLTWKNAANFKLCIQKKIINEVRVPPKGQTLLFLLLKNNNEKHFFLKTSLIFRDLIDLPKAIHISILIYLKNTKYIFLYCKSAGLSWAFFKKIYCVTFASCHLVNLWHIPLWNKVESPCLSKSF